MPQLEEGAMAPDFSGLDQNGHTRSLSDYRGKKLVLYFYPKDNTPGCTAEACNLRDNFSLLKEKGYAILGVSPDSARKHQNFIRKFDLPFPLIADSEKKILKDYGVWGEKQMFGRKYMGVIRTTFVIDEKGRIERIFRQVNTDAHAEQILD